MSYTPGPWIIDHQRIGPPGEPVALLCDVAAPHAATVVDWPRGDDSGTAISIDDAENEANARLIASAPTLLAALTALVESIENVNFGVHDDDGRTYDAIPWAQAEAAIAKATGQEEAL